jgi:hypothetical protein
MKVSNSICIAILSLFIACSMSSEKTTNDKQILAELNKLNELLRDSSFAVKVANYHEAGYANATGTGQSTPTKDSLIKKSFKEDKIATNLAGFYAVECGIGAISKETGKTPVDILKQIAENHLDSSHVLLLNRFANATWKAGQPFRELSRIRRSNFVVAAYLSKEEVKKDYDQVLAAATLLLTKLNSLPADAPVKDQLAAIEKLLKDKAFANEMAAYMEAAYYKGQHQPVPPFIKPEEDTATLMKSAEEERLAINLAGFYALECSVEYLSLTNKQPPSAILKAIINDHLKQSDKELLERFANATWKAGQPFRGLDRITRDIFKPFDLLPQDEVEKDWKQIQMAAELVNAELSKTNPS